MENHTLSEPGDSMSVETKTCNLRTASEQRLYLAHKTLKFMVRAHGSDIRKGIHLGLPVWTLIAKELNALSGVEKTPDMWRKTYTSAKYFVHLKFFRYLKTNKIDKNCINWHLFSIKDLLYLQDLRSEGFPDMPDVHFLLKACEEKKNFLNERPTCSRFDLDNTASNESLQFSNGDDRSMDTFRDSAICVEPGSAAHLADPLNLYDQSTTAESGQQMISYIKIETPQIQCIRESNNEMVYKRFGDIHFSSPNEPANMMSTVHSFPLQSEATTSATRTDLGNNGTSAQIHQVPQPSYHQGETYVAPPIQHLESHPSVHPTVRSHELPHSEWDFEQRLLDINEKMLREKTKHNKLLKKQNRLLDKSRREQCKQTETLNKLLQLLIQRSV